MFKSKALPFFKFLSLLILTSMIFLALAKTSNAQINRVNCTLQDKKLYGKVQVVESFPDFKVKPVNSFPDLNVQIVDSFPDSCGKWKIVESFPDLKIKFVSSFPDLTIKFVESFPGLR